MFILAFALGLGMQLTETALELKDGIVKQYPTEPEMRSATQGQLERGISDLLVPDLQSLELCEQLGRTPDTHLANCRMQVLERFGKRSLVTHYLVRLYIGYGERNVLAITKPDGLEDPSPRASQIALIILGKELFLEYPALIALKYACQSDSSNSVYGGMRDFWEHQPHSIRIDALRLLISRSPKLATQELLAISKRAPKLYDELLKDIDLPSEILNEIFRDSTESSHLTKYLEQKELYSPHKVISAISDLRFEMLPSSAQAVGVRACLMIGQDPFAIWGLQMTAESKSRLLDQALQNGFSNGGATFLGMGAIQAKAYLNIRASLGSPIGSRMADGAIYELASNDLPTALELISSLPLESKDKLRQTAVDAYITASNFNDPNSVFEVALRYQQAGDISLLRKAVLNGASKIGGKAIYRAFDSLSIEDDSKISIIGDLLSSSSAVWLSAREREDLFQSVVGNLPKSLALTASESIASDLYYSEPGRAFDWVERLPPEIRTTTTTALVREMLKADPTTATNWVEAMNKGLTRDIAVSELVQSGSGDLSTAIANLAAISDGVIQEQTTHKLVEKWMQINPTAILSGIDSSNLPASVKQKAKDRISPLVLLK